MLLILPFLGGVGPWTLAAGGLIKRALSLVLVGFIKLLLEPSWLEWFTLLSSIVEL
jgi:hypothetical protein